MLQIDELTRSNTDVAQESSSSTKELLSQVDNLNSNINQLAALIGGKSKEQGYQEVIIKPNRIKLLKAH